MNISPLYELRNLLTQFISESNNLERYFLLLRLDQTWQDLNLEPYQRFYHYSTYITEVHCSFPRDFEPSISGEYERELFLKLSTDTLKSKAKQVHTLFESKLDELIKRAEKQLVIVDQIIEHITDPERLRLYYRIPAHWEFAIDGAEYIFYEQNSPTTCSYFYVYLRRKSDTWTALHSDKRFAPFAPDTWARKLIWPEDYL